ncbi:superoxide dismutase, Mn [Culex quinquefasciatus]|uniref:Superoxide dismutase, Mn n=1 Tax=Culex quinquefasciatus TaxID=7176 RepID=B0XBB6_CULQU|nr:superoxide dismutase, Mn [Culex quinquefasciatus]|eukprot:XP_001866938.1 superoxide dismutase, Mn [Culex quinquefasciatus]
MEVRHQKKHKVYVTNLHLSNEFQLDGAIKLLARDQSDSLAKLKNTLERDFHRLEITKKRNLANPVHWPGNYILLLLWIFLLLWTFSCLTLCGPFCIPCEKETSCDPLSQLILAVSCACSGTSSSTKICV